MAKRKLRICGIFHITEDKSLPKEEVRRYISGLNRNGYSFIGLARSKSMFPPYEECNLLRFLTPYDKVEITIARIIITKYISSYDDTPSYSF